MACQCHTVALIGQCLHYSTTCNHYTAIACIIWFGNLWLASAETIRTSTLQCFKTTRLGVHALQLLNIADDGQAPQIQQLQCSLSSVEHPSRG